MTSTPMSSAAMLPGLVSSLGLPIGAQASHIPGLMSQMVGGIPGQPAFALAPGFVSFVYKNYTVNTKCKF